MAQCWLNKRFPQTLKTNVRIQILSKENCSTFTKTFNKSRQVTPQLKFLHGILWPPLVQYWQPIQAHESPKNVSISLIFADNSLCSDFSEFYPILGQHWPSVGSIKNFLKLWKRMSVFRSYRKKTLLHLPRLLTSRVSRFQNKEKKS